MRKGFTLIEIIIYLGIVTVLLTACLSFAWVIINDQIKQEQLTEVNDAGTFVLDKITYHSKRANAINAQTLYDLNPGKLILNYVSGPQITIDTYEKQITLGDTQTTITKLRLQHGSDPAVDITGDKINVTNFTISDLSNANAYTIQIEFAIETVNPTNSKTYEAQNSWTTSVTLRKRQ
ncbi:prepilin-type N-terminal cleavage/methylation domain-containing protein [Candidatus Kuenenbacteria bacterium]|nr:prepilin-type N-terminal cleavage/methylation domain-containing protein [Candidatus Kuenenbacteria bacterium]